MKEERWKLFKKMRERTEDRRVERASLKQEKRSKRKEKETKKKKETHIRKRYKKREKENGRRRRQGAVFGAEEAKGEKKEREGKRGSPVS